MDCGYHAIKYVLLDYNCDRIQPETQGGMVMYSVRYMHGHVQVYDERGVFLFSADTEREAREELREYEKSAA